MSEQTVTTESNNHNYYQKLLLMYYYKLSLISSSSSLLPLSKVVKLWEYYYGIVCNLLPVYSYNLLYSYYNSILLINLINCKIKAQNEPTTNMNAA